MPTQLTRPIAALAKWLCGSAPVEHKVLLMGDYECGKTTFLDRLKFEQVREHPNHTVNVNVETVEYPKGYNWHIWEIGGMVSLPFMIIYTVPGKN